MLHAYSSLHACEQSEFPFNSKSCGFKREVIYLWETNVHSTTRTIDSKTQDPAIQDFYPFSDDELNSDFGKWWIIFQSNTFFSAGTHVWQHWECLKHMQRCRECMYIVKYISFFSPKYFPDKYLALFSRHLVYSEQRDTSHRFPILEMSLLESGYSPGKLHVTALTTNMAELQRNNLLFVYSG